VTYESVGSKRRECTSDGRSVFGFSSLLWKFPVTPLLIQVLCDAVSQRQLSDLLKSKFYQEPTTIGETMSPWWYCSRKV
jgi:hypothetical protein